MEISSGPTTTRWSSIPPGVWNGFKGMSDHRVVANCCTHPHPDPSRAPRPLREPHPLRLVGAASLNMRVLVTGAGGFIGAHIARALLARGVEVHAVVRDRPGPRLLGVGGLRLERCDLADTHSLGELVARVAPELCFHAGVDRDPGCLPDLARERRPRGGRRAARTRARRRRVSAARRPRHLLRVRAERDPLSESSPLDPTTPYARAKHAAHERLAQVCDGTATSLAWARLFYLYGPYEDPRRLVPAVAARAARGPVGADDGRRAAP